MIYLLLLATMVVTANDNHHIAINIDDNSYLKDEMKNIFNITNPQLLDYAVPLLERKLTQRGREAIHNADVMKKYMSESIEEAFTHKEIEAGNYKINSENNIRRARIAACTNIVTCLITAGVVMAVQFSECGK